VLEACQAWVLHTAQTQVGAEFRDSFLHRNRVNAELLAFATQLAAG
jgi:hypothetical protein